MTEQGRCIVCNDVLPPKAAKGPQRRYCSTRCRMVQLRERRGVEELMPLTDVDADAAAIAEAMGARQVSAEEALAVALGAESAAKPEEQFARAVLDTAALSKSYRRLSSKLQRNLAWRAEGMSDHLNDGLRRYVNGLTDEDDN